MRLSWEGKREVGGASVEFAILLPVLLLLIALSIDFGQALLKTQIITNAARHAARTASGAYQAGRVATFEDSNLDLPCSEYLRLPEVSSLQSVSKRSACSYLNENDSQSERWTVRVETAESIQLDPGDLNFTVNQIRVLIKAEESRCLLCVGPAKLLRPKASSTFLY